MNWTYQWVSSSFFFAYFLCKLEQQQKVFLVVSKWKHNCFMHLKKVQKLLFTPCFCCKTRLLTFTQFLAHFCYPKILAAQNKSSSDSVPFIPIFPSHYLSYVVFLYLPLGYLRFSLTLKSQVDCWAPCRLEPCVKGRLNKDINKDDIYGWRKE